MPGHSTCDDGLTIDSLLSAEVVTADGRILRTSEDQHPELFWGLRGGGGNFGVVTEFEFALHELSELLILATFHPLDEARKVIERGRQEMADPGAPDELLWTSFLRRANDVPWIPPGLVGRHGIMSLVEWPGDPEEGRVRLTEIRDDLAPPQARNPSSRSCSCRPSPTTRAGRCPRRPGSCAPVAAWWPACSPSRKGRRTRWPTKP